MPAFRSDPANTLLSSKRTASFGAGTACGCRGIRNLIRTCGHDPDSIRRYTKLPCRNYGDIGVNPLAHLSAAVINLHGPVLIDQDERPRLIKMGDRKRDSKLHRRNRQTAFYRRMVRIPKRNLVFALRKFARNQQFSPDPWDSVVLNLLAVVGGVSLACPVI